LFWWKHEHSIDGFFIHPHIHCVVLGAGIAKDGSRWIAPRKNSFFLPVIPDPFETGLLGDIDRPAI
jgi:hypothetical protein